MLALILGIIIGLIASLIHPVDGILDELQTAVRGIITVIADTIKKFTD